MFKTRNSFEAQVLSPSTSAKDETKVWQSKVRRVSGEAYRNLVRHLESVRLLKTSLQFI